MDETTDLKIKNLDTDISEIKSQLTDLPDIITKRLNENIELKISLAKKDIEMKFYKYITGLSIGLLGELLIMLIKDLWTHQ